LPPEGLRGDLVDDAVGLSKLAGKVGRKLLLNRKYGLGRQRPVIGLAPVMLAGSRLDQMHDQAHPIRLATDATLDHVADLEPRAQIDRVGVRLIQEAGVSRVESKLAETHQVGDQLFG
jgi:hypothetical protein